MLGNRESRIVPMSMMRRSIAKRLVEAQQTAAMLTTYNEIDMSAVMAIRAEFKDSFLKKHDVKLGFMSFFIRACIEALQEIPEINAYFEDNSLIYHDYCDIGVAIGMPKGLVVPVIRNAEKLSFAETEQQILQYALQARDGKIALGFIGWRNLYHFQWWNLWLIDVISDSQSTSKWNFRDA